MNDMLLLLITNRLLQLANAFDSETILTITKTYMDQTDHGKMD